MSMNLSPNAPPPLPVGPNQAMSMVHQLSDQQLLQMIQHPSSPILQQSALQEMQFRHQARTGPGAMGQQPQPGPQAQAATQGVQSNLAKQQVDKLGGGIGQLPAQAVEGMAGGGIVAFSGEDGSSVQAPPPSGGGFWNSLFGPTYAGQDTGQGFFPVNGPTGGYWRPPPPPSRAPAPYTLPANPDQELAAQYAAAGLDYPSQQADQRQVQAHEQRVQALRATPTGPGYQDANDVRQARAAGRPVPLQPKPAGQGAAPPPPPAPEGNTPQPQSDVISAKGYFGALWPGAPGPNPADETLTKQMAATEAAKRANSGLAMLHMGAAMLQSTSPFAAVALGKGVDAYATSKEAGQAAEQAGLAHIAQTQTEGYKANMDYSGRLGAAALGAYGQIRYGMQVRMAQVDANTRATFERADQAAQMRIQQEFQDEENRLRLNPTANAAALHALDTAKAIKYRQYTQQFMTQFNNVTHNGIGAALPYSGPQPLTGQPPGARVVGGGQ